MEPNPTPSPDWSRLKAMISNFSATARRGVAYQILLGKDLDHAKKTLGFAGSGRRKEKTARAVFSSWPQFCREELGISDDTANRWIACFEYAKRRADAWKKKEPELFRLMQTPSAELDGSELDQLAEFAGRLVDRKLDDGYARLTQTQILKELGIIQESPDLGGDTSHVERKKLTVGELRMIIFGSLPSTIQRLRADMLRRRHGVNYKTLLTELPVVSEDPEEPSLLGLKSEFEALAEEFAPIIKDLEKAIEAKSGLPAKRIRTNTRRP